MKNATNPASLLPWRDLVPLRAPNRAVRARSRRLGRRHQARRNILLCSYAAALLLIYKG
jgi:hypothetical protein